MLIVMLNIISCEVVFTQKLVQQKLADLENSCPKSSFWHFGSTLLYSFEEYRKTFFRCYVLIKESNLA